MCRPRRLLLTILGLATIVVSLGGALLFLAELVFAPPMDYIVRAEFEELPDSDAALEKWLFNQPGVYIGFVHREGNTLSLVWGNSRTHYWNSVTPNVQAEFERFGYKGLIRYQERKEYRDK
jgi:hypothetical protein